MTNDDFNGNGYQSLGTLGTTPFNTNGGSGSGSGTTGETKGGAGNKSNLTSNLAEALKRSSNILTGGLFPSIKSKTAKTVAAGGLAAAGLGLGGAAIAGGVMLNNKMKYYIFKPSDFTSLDEATQNTIIEDLKVGGFDNNQIEKFKTSQFKIASSELNPHIQKVEKAYDNNADFASQFREVYGYSLFDEDDRLDKYLLFVALLIDGANTTDDTNIYNLINTSLDEEEVDFIYSGLEMEAYIDDGSDSEEDEEVEFNSDIDASAGDDTEIPTVAAWIKELEEDNK